MVLCTYLSVNGALEVSVEGTEGVVLGDEVDIHLLQLGGGRPGDGSHWEGMDGNLKLAVYGTALPEETAGQLGERQGKAGLRVLFFPETWRQ